MRFVIATTTLNAADVIGEFLGHVVTLPVDAVFVMDLGSVDETLEIIASARWKGLIEMIPSRGMAEDDPSNVTLEIARQRFPNRWCLFCDPDEFVSPAIARYEPTDDVSVLQLPRFNVTGPQEWMVGDGLPWEALIYEIAQPVVRSAEEMRTVELTPPWIFSRVGDKVAVRLGDVVRIGVGDHVAEVTAGSTMALLDIPIRHYPMRSYRAFELKVRTIDAFFAANPQFPPGWGWHWRRWVKLMHLGRLPEEFARQFIASDDLQGLIAQGTLRRIDSVRR